LPALTARARLGSSVDAFLADVDAAGMDKFQARRTAQTYSAAPY
jgi:hypothetical protein